MPRIQFDPKVTLGNVLTVLSLLVTLIAGYINLKLEVQASSAKLVTLQSQTDQLQDQVEPMQTRLVVVERNQVVGREDRLAFQQKTEATLDKLTSQNAAIMAQLSGIIARMDEAEKRR